MKEFIKFEIKEHKPKTDVYDVKSKRTGTILGRIYWGSRWRQYIFEPFSMTVWSKSCLKQICDFIEKLMMERKKK